MVARGFRAASGPLLYSVRMFTNFIRLAILAEIATWTALASRAVQHGWGVAAAAGGAIAGALMVRLALVCLTATTAHFARSPRSSGEGLGLLGVAILVANEWRAMLANNLLWIPFERQVLRTDPPLAPDARMPVIVLHGYFSNRGTVCALARALDAAGVGPVFVPTLPAAVAPIEEYAADLDRFLRAVTQATGQPRAFLVCHSMAGLGARAYMVAHGTGRVAGLVTLGSPHHGTVLAVLGVGANARQMRIGSEFVRSLEGAEGEGGPGCPALSVYTVHDNLVAPQDSSRLAWARNMPISGVAHLAMLLDARVHRAVLDEIERVTSRHAA